MSWKTNSSLILLIFIVIVIVIVVIIHNMNIDTTITSKGYSVVFGLLAGSMGYS